MNIGYIRMGLPIELNLSMGSANTLGTEIRAGMLNYWKDKHNITFYTPIKKKDMQFIGRNKYKLLGFPKNEDVLFIEMGVTNELYRYNAMNKNKSYIKRMLECIDNFEGKCIYYQHGCLKFPFEYYNKKIDLFKNKEWEILHHFTNEKLFKDKFYPKIKNVRFRFMPICYSDIDPRFKIKESPRYDSMFIGSAWDSASKSTGFIRFNEIKKFYDTNLFKSALIGKWEKEYLSKFRYLTYLGHVGTHSDAYTYWNDSLTCVWTTSPEVKRFGLLPTRPIMCIRAGCLLVADKEINDINKYVDEKYIVSDAKDVSKLITEHKKLSLEEREIIREKQLSKFPKWGEHSIIGGIK